jgi:hypothetical protein
MSDVQRYATPSQNGVAVATQAAADLPPPPPATTPDDYLLEASLAAATGFARNRLVNFRECLVKGEDWFRTNLGINWRRRGVRKFLDMFEIPDPEALCYTIVEPKPVKPKTATQTEFPVEARVTKLFQATCRWMECATQDGTKIKVRIDPKWMAPRPWIHRGMIIYCRFLRDPNIHVTRKPRKPGHWS